jgi:hypothetical protein
VEELVLSAIEANNVGLREKHYTKPPYLNPSAFEVVTVTAKLKSYIYITKVPTSSVFLDRTPCSPAEVNQYFRATFHLHLPH